MDMGLTINDSFYIDYGYGTMGGIKSAVDSIYFMNGRKHIRLDYTVRITYGLPYPSYVNYTMIEGVGVNVKGINNQANGILVNQWKDSALVYSADLDSIFICQSITGIREKNSNVYIKLYPNPIHQSASIEMKGIKAEKIQLFDLQGKLVKNLPNNRRTVNFEEIKNGIYFLKVTSVGKQEICKKVVVQH